MDEVIDRIEKIEKIRDNLYRYDLVQTKVFQTNVETLNGQKAVLLKRIFNIDYLLAEIEKLDVVEL